jgi:hypothetical protein
MNEVPTHASRRVRCLAVGCCLALLAGAVAAVGRADRPLADDYTARVRPVMAKYCLACHSTAKKKGDLDLERFATVEQARRDLRPWQAVVEMLENGEMPPKKNPQPSSEERLLLVAWARALLDSEARARAGDPGRVVVRRLSNAEYNNTIRDLTRVDLQPARDFPADGAAGEGFTNAGDALVISPTLLGKYLKAAKDVAAHAVLLPDGFRFSPTRTRRDWTDEAVDELRRFYRQFSPDGRLPLQPYVAATLRHREAIASGKATLEAVAEREKLSPKYLRTLWQALNDPKPSFPLDRVRARWRHSGPGDAGAVVAEVLAWQGPPSVVKGMWDPNKPDASSGWSLWRLAAIGSYRNETRQIPADPSVAPAQTLRVKVKPEPGKDEVVLYLAAREFPSPREGTLAVWQRPRFEAAGKPPLLLRDYSQFGGPLEVEHAAIFADTAKYLAAAVEAANDRAATAESLAKKYGLDAALLARWMGVLAVEPLVREKPDGSEIRRMRALPWQLLSRKLPEKPTINGWRNPEGEELPVVVSNSSDRVEMIPGTVQPHRVAMHPTPKEFVAVAWKSPVDGPVRIEARIAHAHPACGNGVTWWLEHRRAEQAAILDGGAIDLGKWGEARPREWKVGKGDFIVLAVGARDLNHVCDLTAVDLTLTEPGKGGRTWDLARDTADSILAGNPHADRHGNVGVWQFVKGPDPTEQGKPVVGSPAAGVLAGAKIPPGSVLGRWRSAAADPRRQAEVAGLAAQAQALLTGPRPADEKAPDRILYDSLVPFDGPLLQGIDLGRWAKASGGGKTRFGLEREQFGRHPRGQAAEEASLVVPATSVLEVRLPAALFRDREFVVEGKLDPAGGEGLAQLQVLTAPPQPDAPLAPRGPFVGLPTGAAAKQLLQGCEEFRRIFPPFISYNRVVPDDEVVCLKLYHREDEPLVRLFLDDAQSREVERLWAEHRFISQWPVTEHKQLPLFIGFVTQDQPKELVVFFENKREPFRKRAEAFEKERDAAAPWHLAALLDFAGRAYRRPLEEKEKTELMGLYATLRKKEMSHEEALRTVLTRVLVSPSFLFRVERAAPGMEAQPVSDWELATRLSYFLWATMPDAELTRAAAEGRLREPKDLAAQAARMLKDPKVRGMATEFGAQWLHVRDVRQNREKNEKLFPTFDDNLREAIFEESVLFFQDLFQADRPLHEVLDADHTFLNETLARHYAIPGVAGPAWRRVDGVRKYGRGGILALGSVLTTQSGASRTSPVLRGNWLVEVMLGEKLPKPPPNVPRLPEEETGGEATVRQMVERHARIAECAVCHQRIDPFGFALEKYDPIGRFRDRDLGGRPIDAKVRLKDGTEFEGIEGLRRYLLTQRGEEFQRHFCRKLLGYALGRTVMLSDQPLLDEMVGRLKKNDGRLSAPVLAVVESRQFRYHRGLDATRDE